jgi:excisionase family DNA binding protein
MIARIWLYLYLDTGRKRVQYQLKPHREEPFNAMDGNNERLLTPGEVAALFSCRPEDSLTQWAASGRITSIRTPGGHRRFRETEIRALLRVDSS